MSLSLVVITDEIHAWIVDCGLIRMDGWMETILSRFPCVDLHNKVDKCQ